MATKRTEKKKARRQTQLLAAHLGESTPIRAVRLQKVRVPCPMCAHPTMRRRYLPVLGGASGVACCPNCSVEMPYERVLAAAMGEAIGVEGPPAHLARAEEIAVITRPSAGTVVKELVALGVIALRRTLGMQRRWSFAAARA